MTANLIIRVQCPYCDKTLNIDAKYAGQWGKCKHCGGAIEVPPIASPVTTQTASEPPIAVTQDSCIRCEKCGGVMVREVLQGKDDSGTIGCCAILLLIVGIVVWPLLIAGAGVFVYAVIKAFSVPKKSVMKCSRCGFFYECM